MKEPNRTLEQNDKMHAAIRDVSRQVQWPVDGRLEWLSEDEWKLIFTAALVKHQRVAAGIDGGFVILGRSTKRLKVSEMSDLIEIIQSFGAARNVKWTEPKKQAA